MKKFNLLFAGALVAGMATFSSCSSDGDNVDVPYIPGIPGDDLVTPNPNVPDPNTELPNFTYTIDKELGWAVIRLDMTGVLDPSTGESLRLFGPADRSKQNIWLSIDGKPKGFSIVNTAELEDEVKKPVIDLVFLVDNSTSMSQEADSIAEDIVKWAKSLEKNNDLRVGCVGYGGFISGAINLTTADSLKIWLEKGQTGVMRTRDFEDRTQEEADSLKAAAALLDYRVVGTGYSYLYRSDPDESECGLLALRFANDKFRFRPYSNRIYVNLTDEPNQPKGNENFSTEWVSKEGNWPVTNGTIHTVYSADSTFSVQKYYNERPWDLSDLTGGSKMFVNGYFRGVSLDSLKVTKVLQNSYIIKITNVEDVVDGQPHNVWITVKTADNKVFGDKHYNVLFRKQEE